MITLDAYRSKGLLGPFPNALISISDVEQAFDRIESLKYSQPFSFTGKLQGFTVTAYNAGHTLGGTIWKIEKDHEDIVYAVDWNHSRDSHLNGAAFLQQNGTIIDPLSRPSVMICGSKVGEPGQQSLRKRKDALFSCIQETIGRGGTVLIPTSSGSRVLELCHILDSYWSSEKISAPLVYFSHVGARTLSYASSMLEWMSSVVIDEWQVKNNSPFETKNIKIITDLEELKTMDGPKVILASGEALELGFSRLLFAELCAIDSTTVLLTEKAEQGSLAYYLQDLWNKEQSGDPTAVQLTTKLSINYIVEQPLEAEELFRYSEQIRMEKETEEKQAAIDLYNKTVLEQQENESEEESEEEIELSTASSKIDLGVLLYGNEVYDYDVLNSKIKTPMFPYAPKYRRVDDYGEIIKVEDFSKTSDRPDIAIEKSSSTRIGEKRKWEDDYGGETSKLDAKSLRATPKKLIPTNNNLKILCRVNFIDFEGLADDRSMRMILPLIQPKKLIFLSNNNEDSKLADDYVEQGLEAVVVAKPNETLAASSEIYIFNVKVTPELENLLKWQRILGDFAVAHITGRLIIGGEDDGDIKMNNDEDENIEEEMKEFEKREISIMPLQTAKELASAPRANPLFVGDIKLAELKKKLIAQGHKAEFRAEGILVCDDKVAVRKVSEGQIVIDGILGQEFYETKTVVRSLLATV